MSKGPIKKVFEQEFNMESIRTQILTKEEENKEVYINKYFMYILPACLIIFICAVSSIPLKPTHDKDVFLDSITTTDEVVELNDNNIKINKIDNTSLARLDADIQEITNDINMLWPNFLKDGINIPKSLNKSNASAIYTRKDQNSNYDILNCYVYNYFNENQTKNIRLAFSSNTKPIRDYYFDEVGEFSQIKDTKLVIYQFESTYFTEFKYQNYNFDIETNNISLEELKNLLTSIIK